MADSRTGGAVKICTASDEAVGYFEERRLAVGAAPFAVAVPSVVAPIWNVVLYPAHRGFWEHVSLESVDPYEFDARLFPENDPTES